MIPPILKRHLALTKDLILYPFLTDHEEAPLYALVTDRSFRRRALVCYPDRNPEAPEVDLLGEDPPGRDELIALLTEERTLIFLRSWLKHGSAYGRISAMLGAIHMQGNRLREQVREEAPYTLREVAEKLKTSTRTVSRYIGKGYLKAIQPVPGGPVWITRAAFRRFLGE